MGRKLREFLTREPTLWIAFFAALLNFGVTFGWDGLTAVHAAWINTVINAGLGLYAALRTRPIAPQAVTYAVTSLAGLLAAYGLSLDQEAVGMFNLTALAFLALLTRGQVSPNEDARVTGVLGNKVTTDALPPTSRH